MAYDPVTGEVFVANYYSDNLTVLSGATDTPVGNVTTGLGPLCLTYDSRTGDLYGTNYDGGTLSIITGGSGGGYGVTFTETGLPTGTNWAVTLNGVQLSSTSTSIAFTEPNGTYSYTVGPVPGYAAAVDSGSVTVNGVGLERGVVFAPVSGPYSVIFSETGLPAGGEWYVNVTGQGSVVSSTTSAALQLANGTYPFTVASANKQYAPSPARGSIEVSGTAASESVTFTLETYPVSYAESGLPSGASWSVTVAGTTHTSTTATVAFMEPNGTYAYSVGSTGGFGPNPANGTVTVVGGAQTIPVSYAKVFALIFTASNLPSGTNWSVTVTGGSSSVVLLTPSGSSSTTLTRWSGGASTIRFYVSNGSYSYSSSAPGRTNTSGTLTVSGTTAAPVSVSFPTGSSGFPLLGYAAIGIAVVVVAVIAGLGLMRIRGKAPPASAMPQMPSGQGPPPPPSP
jgi:hypothetical protein